MKSDGASRYVHEGYEQCVGLLFFAAPLQVIFAKAHAHRTLVDLWCMKVWQDWKHVCLQHAKQTLALTALGGHTFFSDQTLFPMQKEENGFIRNMKDQENLYSILAEYVCWK